MLFSFQKFSHFVVLRLIMLLTLVRPEVVKFFYDFGLCLDLTAAAVSWLHWLARSAARARTADLLAGAHSSMFVRRCVR